MVLPLLGAATDRWGARRIVIFALVITALSSMVLAALAAADQLNTNILLAISLFHGFAGFLVGPARSVLFAEILRRDDLVAGLALNSVTLAISRFSGPAFVVMMQARLGFAAAILVSGVAAAVFAAAVYFLRLSNPKLQTPSGLTQAGKLFGRVRRVKDDPAIGFFIFVLLIPFFLVIPYTQLLPGIMDDVFDRGRGGLTTMNLALAAGGTLTSVILIFRNRWRGVTRLFIFAVPTLTIGYLALSLVQLFWMALIILFFMGATRSVMGIALQSLLLGGARENARGAVVGTSMWITRGAPAAGAFVIGVIADHAGMQWAIAIPALLAVALWISFYKPLSRHANNLEYRAELDPAVLRRFD